MALTKVQRQKKRERRHAKRNNKAKLKKTIKGVFSHLITLRQTYVETRRINGLLLSRANQAVKENEELWYTLAILRDEKKIGFWKRVKFALWGGKW